MTAIRPQGLEGFLRKPDPAVGILLIYGDEPAAIRDLAARAVKQVAGSLDDPFTVVRLDDGALAADPARLADEMQSISMFGGRRAIWVREAGEAFLRAAEPVLDGRASGNLIVAEAGALAKSSALRNALEQSPRALILPVYEADDADISSMIEQTLAKAGLAIDPDAKFLLMERVGTGRALMQRELEKLALYAMGQDRIGLADVEASCSGGAEFETGDLADAMFAGEIEDSDRMFGVLVQSGIDAGRLLGAAHLHALKLQDLRLAIDAGSRMEQVLRGARPPIFFKRMPAFQLQLGLWPLANLMQASTTLAAAVTQARLNASLAEAIANRAVLAVARNARALAADRR